MLFYCQFQANVWPASVGKVHQTSTTASEIEQIFGSILNRIYPTLLITSFPGNSKESVFS